MSFSRKRVGLALGGGSVRGMAHLGVLEVLEREGIRPDYVAGTSAGAAVGSVYCAGLGLPTIMEIAKALRWKRLGRLVPSRLGFLDSRRLGDEVAAAIGDVTFDQLAIPFAAVAVDITRSQLVVMREGSVSEAVSASCAVPGVFTPVERRNALLVDGGVLNNLPVSVVRQMGAEYVIAVDLLPPTVLGEKPRTLLGLWYAAFYTLVRATHIEGNLADSVIAPDVGKFGWIDFSQGPALIKAGRLAAEERIDQIKRDLAER